MTHVQDNAALLAALKRELPRLLQLRERLANDAGIYKFYSQSYKAFRMQDDTEAIVAVLQDVAPDLRLHPWFLQIVREGTGHQFSVAMNSQWLAHTRKIAEAYLHARHLLEAAIEVSKLPSLDEGLLPSAWFTIHDLYTAADKWLTPKP